MSVGSSTQDDIELISQCDDSLQPLPTDDDLDDSSSSDITLSSIALASDNEEGGTPDAALAFGVPSSELDAIFKEDFLPSRLNADQPPHVPRAHSSQAMRQPLANASASPMALAGGKNLAASIIDLAKELEKRSPVMIDWEVEQVDHKEQLKAEIVAQKCEIRELKAKIDSQKADIDALNAKLNQLREKNKELEASLEKHEAGKNTSETTTLGGFIYGAATSYWTTGAAIAAFLICLSLQASAEAIFATLAASAILIVQLLMLCVKRFNKKWARGKKP